MTTKDKLKNKFKEDYIKLFNELLKEKDPEKQDIIAKEISDFSALTYKTIETLKDKSLEEINETCLPMEHWKDDTGYCNLTKSDIKKFVKELNK